MDKQDLIRNANSALDSFDEAIDCASSAFMQAWSLFAITDTKGDKPFMMDYDLRCVVTKMSEYRAVVEQLIAGLEGENHD